MIILLNLVDSDENKHFLSSDIDDHSFSSGVDDHSLSGYKRSFIFLRVDGHYSLLIMQTIMSLFLVVESKYIAH